MDQDTTVVTADMAAMVGEEGGRTPSSIPPTRIALVHY